MSKESNRLAPVPSGYSRQEEPRVLFGGRPVLMSKQTKTEARTMATVKYKVKLNVVAEDDELLDTIELVGLDLDNSNHQSFILDDIRSAIGILDVRAKIQAQGST